MVASRCYRCHSLLLAIAIGIVGLTTGCCGPMACGPMSCGSCSTGPVMAGACGGNGCNGCGETYIDEWINHPPSCDPCDSCGNHNGQSCTACRPMFDGFKSLWGYRRDCGCGHSGCDSCGTASCESGCDGGCDSGCESCGGGHMSMAEHEVGHHYVDSSSAIPMPHRPSPAPQIVDAKPAIKPYQPQRTKQIFRPKGSIAGSSSQPRGY